jgi:hypothetical protein
LPLGYVAAEIKAGRLVALMRNAIMSRAMRSPGRIEALLDEIDKGAADRNIETDHRMLRDESGQ